MLNQNFIEKYSDQVSVEDMLADLIPGFLKNKANDLITLNQALAEKDFEKIKKIGHNWKGACSSYGFNYLGEVGKEFEALANNKDEVKLKVIIDSLPQYLDNVQVSYVSSPDESTPNNSHLHS